MMPEASERNLFQRDEKSDNQVDADRVARMMNLVR
jgi:hypothetical protein